MTTTIANLRFAVLSPSFLRLVGWPIEILFDGYAWRIFVREIVTEHGYRTRDEACASLARAMQG